MKHWLIFLGITALVWLFIFSSEAKAAGPYLDIGLSYVDELQVSERGYINFNDDYFIEAELSATLDVAEWVGMLRAGYLFKSGIGIEYDSIGTPDLYFRRWNIYYRVEFWENK